ncbi:SUF system NifU family Fe-S cluster assembly protein [Wenzhouxiangella sp. AB-CW3]|uniref:Fe-S cluster assembly sulfur transfer protein SufU n=1 Tax=Wenzhouxiangella sp. AB-CW3 TaxID=2771012 RepID=UPI00168BAB05|nr:SUF system NifU family Fe-S cluster assembly protein [Wenzhouxiangella sp. AB-CW3]QOC21702.1 SUF system NifU family Fe-S cluster assembly protein [Wenzhouxiangella sp. AB-CW3]
MVLDKLYQQLVLDHNRAPRNFGPLSGATHAARGHDALCGDDILVELVVEEDRIARAGFSGEACAITKASASMLTEWLAGRSRAEFEQAFARFEQMLANPDTPPCPDLGDINELQAVSDFPARVRNALLPWKTVLRALGGVMGEP